MNNYMDIILLAIMVPTLLIMFFYEYPAKWEDRKFIFGVRNREEFKTPDAASEIGKIAACARKQAVIILICSFVVMGLIMLIPDMLIGMNLWILFVFAALIVFMVPFMRANREMKSLKRALGINSSKGTVYTDLKGAGAVHALKVSRMIIPAVVAALFFTVSLMTDLGAAGLSDIAEKSGQYVPFALTSMTGSFLFIGIILIPLAVMMDRIRNDVISDDSDTNMNYNRAKKKAFADTFVLMTWANTVMTAAAVPVMFFAKGDIAMVLLMSAYMLLLIGSVIIFARRNLAIDRCYRKETTIDVDDDDNWILGSFYYNPADKRLNVSKRMGIGGTINIAHPAGKVIMAATALLILAAIILAAYSSVIGRASMNIRIENGTLICRQFTDCIKVPVDTIEDIELCKDPSELGLLRQAGFELPPIHNGTYTVDGVRGCKVFLNTDSEVYMTFRAGETTYYITGTDDAETNNVFGSLSAD